MDELNLPFDANNEYFKCLTRSFKLCINGDDYYFTWKESINDDQYDFVLNPYSLKLDPYDDCTDQEIKRVLGKRFIKIPGIEKHITNDIYKQFGFTATERIPPNMINPLQRDREDTFYRIKDKLRTAYSCNQEILNILKVIAYETDRIFRTKMKEISKLDNPLLNIHSYSLQDLRNKLNGIKKALEVCQSEPSIQRLIGNFFGNNSYLDRELSQITTKAIKKILLRRESTAIKDLHNLTHRYFGIDEILDIHLTGRFNVQNFEKQPLKISPLLLKLSRQYKNNPNTTYSLLEIQFVLAVTEQFKTEKNISLLIRIIQAHPECPDSIKDTEPFNASNKHAKRQRHVIDFFDSETGNKRR